MSANTPNNLIDLLTPGHIDDIVNTLNINSYYAVYDLSVETQIAILDRIRLNSVFVFKFPAPQQLQDYYSDSEVFRFVYDHYYHLLMNNSNSLYDEAVTESLYVQIGLIINHYRLSLDETDKIKLSMIVNSAFREIMQFNKIHRSVDSGHINVLGYCI